MSITFHSMPELFRHFVITVQYNVRHIDIDWNCHLICIFPHFCMDSDHMIQLHHSPSPVYIYSWNLREYFIQWMENHQNIIMTVTMFMQWYRLDESYLAALAQLHSVSADEHRWFFGGYVVNSSRTWCESAIAALVNLHEYLPLLDIDSTTIHLYQRSYHRSEDMDIKRTHQMKTIRILSMICPKIQRKTESVQTSIRALWQSVSLITTLCSSNWMVSPSGAIKCSV